MSEVFLGFVLMFALSAMRVPIAFSMGVVGFLGNWPVTQLARRCFISHDGHPGNGHVLHALSGAAVVLMGNLVQRAALSEALYRSAHSLIGHRRAGLVMSTLLACGEFAAICGSSLATTAAMSKVAMPEMRRFGYAQASQPPPSLPAAPWES